MINAAEGFPGYDMSMIIGPTPDLGIELPDHGYGVHAEMLTDCFPDIPQECFYIRLGRVKYDDRYPWPANTDGTGFTLNRINDALYGNDVGNWQSDIPSPGRSIKMP